MTTYRRYLTAFVLAVALTAGVGLTGCAKSASTSTPAAPKSSLQVVQSTLLDIAQSVGQVQNAVIGANNQKLISDATATQILTVTQKIALAGKQADAIILGASTLTPGNKASLLALFQPVAQAISDSITTGLVSIKDQGTANNIRLLLTTIQGAFSAAQIALAGGN